MIFLFHVAAGVLIAYKIKFLPLAILVAFLSHYALDFIPHPEYSAQNIKDKQWKKSGLDFLRVVIDVGIGLILIIIVHQMTGTNYLALITTSFSSILPDILSASSWLWPNNKFLRYHSILHQKIHFKETAEGNQVNSSNNKKISAWAKIILQVLVVLIGITIFFL